MVTSYCNIGFNFKEDYTPTLGWDFYAVNLMEGWENHIQDDGTVSIKLIEEGGDSAQTAVMVDFM